MPEFEEQYRRTFLNLGYPLKPRDRRAESRIVAAEQRLGILMPLAVREYFLVAGAERRFNQVYDRLLPPHEWFIENGHVVFMVENQVVVLWGVTATSTLQPDPSAFMGANGKEIVWHLEHERCSTFLKVMIHWHGAYAGAMQYSNTARVAPELVNQLDSDWQFVGEVNGMRAYNRDRQAACLVEWEDSWRIFGGATTKTGMSEIAHDLGINWEVGEPTLG